MKTVSFGAWSGAEPVPADGNGWHAAVAAVSRLNSWVRSESFRQGFNSRSMVYWLKRCALKDAVRRPGTAHRLVAVAAKCWDCGGTGRYVSAWGTEFDHCWKCNNSGTARLEFVETTLADGTVWHSPWEKFPGVRPDRPAEEVADWAPHRAGQDLDPWQVAEALNIAEDYLLPRHGTPIPDPERDSGYPYKLFLGTARAACAFCSCSDEHELQAHIVGAKTVRWRDRACQACCDALGKAGISIWGLFPFPIHLTTHPAIGAWMESPWRERGSREEAW